MATDTTKVAVAITGAVSVGPTSATAPTSQSSTLTGFTDLGGISEDGVVRTNPGAGDSTVLKFWQNGQQARVIRAAGDEAPRFTFTLMETNKIAVETALGVTVTQTATEGSYVVSAGQIPTNKSWVLDVVDGSELERQYIHKGAVVELGDTTYNGDGSINLEVTVECDYSSTLSGHYKVWSTRLKS